MHIFVWIRGSLRIIILPLELTWTSRLNGNLWKAQLIFIFPSSSWDTPWLLSPPIPELFLQLGCICIKKQQSDSTLTFCIRQSCWFLNHGLPRDGRKQYLLSSSPNRLIFLWNFSIPLFRSKLCSLLRQLDMSDRRICQDEFLEIREDYRSQV